MQGSERLEEALAASEKARLAAEGAVRDMQLRHDSLEAVIEKMVVELHEQEAKHGRELTLRNDALESLVNSLMGELEAQESRRSRDRQRRHSDVTCAVVPFAAVQDAKHALVEGSCALVAAHEHTTG